jgi:hypothetical protein
MTAIGNAIAQNKDGAIAGDMHVRSIVLRDATSTCLSGVIIAAIQKEV